MRLNSIVQILTLVLCVAGILLGVTAIAAPLMPVPESSLRPEVKRKAETDSPRGFELDSVAPSQIPGEIPPPLSEARMEATRVVRTQSRSLLLGFVSGAIEETEPQTLSLLTLNFQNDNQNETAQSYGLTITNSSAWGLHWDTHSYCCMGEKAEPFWGVGIGSFYDSHEQLASLVNIERYHLRARLGFEDLFGLGRRLRGEFLVRAAPVGVSGQISIGWTWSAAEFIF